MRLKRVDRLETCVDKQITSRWNEYIDSFIRLALNSKDMEYL